MQDGFRLLKIFASVALVITVAGCSFTGSNTAPVVEGPTSTTIYTVKPGDTLYSICRRYSVDPKLVARNNNLTDPSTLRIGQKLRISISENSSYSKSAAAAPAPKQASTTTAEKPVVTQPQPTRSVVQNTNGSFAWPASGAIVKAYSTSNRGIDIAGKEGDPVYAAADGEVIVVGNMRGYGNLVIVKHNQTYVTAYSHVKNIVVKQNDTVNKGQKLATIGKTDEASPRVHFEIRKVGKPVDPTTMLPSR